MFCRVGQIDVRFLGYKRAGANKFVWEESSNDRTGWCTLDDASETYLNVYSK